MATLLSDQLKQLQSNQFAAGQRTTDSFSKSTIELSQDAGPTAHLNNDPFAFSSISYPRDVTQDKQNGHYMLFYINVQNKTKYNYIDANTGQAVRQNTSKQVPTLDGPPGSTKTVPSETFYGDTDASYRNNIQKGGKGSVLDSDKVNLRKGRKAMTGFSSVMPTTSRITDSIAIYLPPNVSDSITSEYDGAEMGVLGLAAAGAVDFTRAMARNDFSAASGALMGSAKGIAFEAAKRMGSAFVGDLAGVDPEAITQFANKAFGQAVNPYMEVLYKGTGLRSFTYNFTFQPRNEDETNDVQKIIKMFRFHMLPELQGANERFLTLPSTFDIHYMFQMDPKLSNNDTGVATENSFYSKIATCVLKGVDVNYTPEGVKSFESGAPTAITMNLSFMETEMLTKQHVDRGF